MVMLLRREMLLFFGLVLFLSVFGVTAKTASAFDVPYEYIYTSNVTSNSVNIFWQTYTNSTGLVSYSTQMVGSRLQESTPCTGTEFLSYAHCTALSGLTPGTSYNYIIYASDETGSVGQSEMKFFSTPGTVGAPPPPPLPPPPPIDTTPPSVTGYNYIVDNNNKLSVTVTFSEAMDVATLNEVGLKILINGDLLPVTISQLTGGTMVKLVSIPEVVTGVTYALSVLPSVADVAHNTLPNVYYRTFVVDIQNVPPPPPAPAPIDTVAPYVSGIQYSLNDNGQLVAYVTFSEAMDQNSLASTNFRVGYTSGQDVEFELVKSTTGVRLRTYQNIPSGSSVFVNVSSLVKDVAGNQMVNSYSKVFDAPGPVSLPQPIPSPVPLPVPASAPIPAPPPPEPIVTTSPVVTGNKMVNGTVMYSDGKPSSDFYIGAYETSSGTHTKTLVNGDGSFSLQLPGGTWKIAVFPISDNGQRPQIDAVTVSFSSNQMAETRTVPFTLPAPGGVVSVIALDENGSLLANAAITADSISGTGQGSASLRVVIANSTDSRGMTSFTLPAGKYYFRGNPPSSIYVSPDEWAATVGSGSNETIQLIFKHKPVASAEDRVRGTVHFSDGAAAPDAYVYAWSEEGASIDVRTDANGNFSIQLPKSAHWRLGAKKMRESKPYSSSEIEVSSDLYTQSVDLVLLKKVREVRDVVVVIPQANGGVQAVQAMSGMMGAMSVKTDSIAPESPSLRLSVSPTVEVPTQAATEVIGVAYDVTLRDTTGAKVTSFSQKIEIDLPYSTEDLRSEGATEKTIRPSYFDEKTGTWIPIDDFYVDTVRKVVVVHVSHLTRFAIVSPADITPPAPPKNLSVAVAGANVKLSWKNPSGDFDHAKVYRSTASGKLGTVLASEVRSSTFADNTTNKGAKYFYTVRTIDLAGNESENTNQVAASGVGSGSSANSLTKTLSLGMSGKEVTLLQAILKKLGFLTVEPSGYFGLKTKLAVIAFQNTYPAELLVPAGLSKGSGVVGALTRKKLNTLNGGN